MKQFYTEPEISVVLLAARERLSLLEDEDMLSGEIDGVVEEDEDIEFIIP